MRPNHAVRHSGAFTLVEMIVTICVIALLTSIAMPGLVQLFRSGADAQAYNIVSAELVNARNNAIQKSVYSGVHFQAGDAKAGYADTFYIAVVDRPSGAAGASGFGLADGYMLQELPGHIAVGQIDGFVDSATTDYNGDFSDANLKKFTTGTVVFGPQGNVVQTVPDTAGAAKPILFDAASGLFTGNPYWLAATANDTGTGKNGATAVTLFEYKVMTAWDVGKRSAFLNQFAQVMPINLYTGQLYDRK